MPNYSNLPKQEEFDWTRTGYGEVKEEVPDNIPKPLGKPVATTTYVVSCMTYSQENWSQVFQKQQSTAENATRFIIQKDLNVQAD